MPKIEEYNYQTSAAGPDRQVAANVEDTGNVGTALENAGGKMEAAASYMNRRARQADVSNQAAGLSNMRATLTQELTDRVQSATPDDIAGRNADGSPGQSMVDKFSDYIDEQMQKQEAPSTAAGREFSERQNAALRQHLLTTMGKQQAALAGANAVQTVRNTVNTGANTLEEDPTQYKLALDAHSAYVDHMVAAEGLPASHAEAMRQYGNQQLAEGAARGYIKADPTTGKALLDSGMFDNNLTRQQKDSLYVFADGQARAQGVETNRVQKQAADAQQEVVDTRMAHYIQLKNTPGAKAVPLPQALQDPAFKNNPQAMNALIGVYDRANRDDTKGNPTLFNDLVKQMNDPTNPNPPTKQHLATMLGVAGGISVPQYNLLTKMAANTPSGQEDKAAKAGFFAQARGQILGKDQYGNIDPSGPTRFASFQTQALQALDKGQQQGKTVQQMLSPTGPDGKPNPDYIGGILNGYRQTPQQRLQAMAAARRGTALVPTPNTGPTAPAPAVNPSAPAAPATNVIPAQPATNPGVSKTEAARQKVLTDMRAPTVVQSALGRLWDSGKAYYGTNSDEGKTALNPKTGETLVNRGGKWVPYGR